MRDPRRELISKVPLFRQLEPKQLDALVEAFEERNFAPGAPLAKQGESGQDLFLIKEGEVEVVASRRGADKSTLGCLGPGSFFGELAAIERQSYRASYVALSPTICLVLPADRLTKVLHRDPAFALTLLRRLSLRVPATDQLSFDMFDVPGQRAQDDQASKIVWKTNVSAAGEEETERAKLAAERARLAKEQLNIYLLLVQFVSQEAESRESVLALVKMLVRAIEAKSERLRGHAAQAARWARATAIQLGWDDDKVAMASLGGLLHDIGLLTVDREALNKSNGYSEEERGQIQAHPQLGAQIVGAVSFLRSAVPFVLYHHERWDGRGYPNRFAGKRIPIEGRLMATVETFLELLQRRPIQDVSVRTWATTQLQHLKGTQLDPTFVNALLDAIQAEETAAGSANPQDGDGEREPATG